MIEPEATRAAKRMDRQLEAKSRHPRGVNLNYHARNLARKIDSQLGILPQKKGRAGRMLAAEKRKALKEPSTPHFRHSRWQRNTGY